MAWSRDLQEYTREHFADFGASILKSDKGLEGAVGYERTLYIDDEAKALIPPGISDSIVLFSFTGRTGFLSFKGRAFLTSYESIDAMIDDGWVID